MTKENELSAIYFSLLKNHHRNLVDSRILAMTNNSLIYPSKISPETLNAYSFLDTKFPGIKTGLNIGFWLLRIPIGLLCEFTRNGFSRLILPRFHEDTSNKRNVVTLTHISQNSRVANNVFCEAIESVSGAESVLRVFLSNSNILGRLKLIRTNRNKSILRQDTNFQSLIKISITNVLASAYLAKKSLFTKGLSAEYRVYLSRAASNQIRRYSFSNLILLNEISNIIKSNGSKIIMIPFEGHSNEITLIHNLPKITECQKVIAYQHAPIVESQIAFFSGLENLGVKNYLCVTGEVIASIVRSKTGFSHRNIRTIGSEKNLVSALPPKFQFREIDQGVSVLGLPEASMNAVDEVIETMNEIALENPEVKMVIRLHPSLSRIKKNIATKKVLESKISIRISDASLLQDLMASSFSLSRSSAALVQGMQFKVVPLFVTKLPQNLLSPINLIQNLSGEIQESLLNSQSLINSPILKRLKHKKIGIEIQQIGESYFSKLDLKSMYSLIVD